VAARPISGPAAGWSRRPQFSNDNCPPEASELTEKNSVSAPNSSLLQHRDCISRVVLDRCSDSSPAAVDILMGARRRELFITCRNFNRDLCSGALSSLLGSSPLLVWAASLLAGLLTLRRQVCL